MDFVLKICFCCMSFHAIPNHSHTRAHGHHKICCSEILTTLTTKPRVSFVFSDADCLTQNKLCDSTKSLVTQVEFQLCIKILIRVRFLLKFSYYILGLPYNILYNLCKMHRIKRCLDYQKYKEQNVRIFRQYKNLIIL